MLERGFKREICRFVFLLKKLQTTATSCKLMLKRLHPECCVVVTNPHPGFWKLDIKNSRMLLLRTSMEPFWSNYQFGSSLDVWFQQPMGALVDGTQVPKSMVHLWINECITFIPVTRNVAKHQLDYGVYIVGIAEKITVSWGPKMAFYARILTQSWTISEVYQPKSNPKYGTGKQDLKVFIQKLQVTTTRRFRMS